jgi:hypothetical protein
MDLNQREDAVVLWAGVGLAVLACLPFLIGALLSTPKLEFTGLVIGFEDGNTYLAKMVQGAHGAWTYRLAFTSESHPGGIFYLMYLLLGKVAGLTGIPPIWLFHLSRLIATPLALYSFYKLAAYFSPHPTIRRLAALLFAIGSGLGWLWVLLRLPIALGQMPVDLWVPDASFFLSVLTYPHLIVGQALLFAYLVCALRFLDVGRWPDGVGAALAGLGVSLIHPYTLPVIVVPVGLFVLWRGRRNRQTSAALVGRFGLTVLPSLPYLVYAVVFFSINRVYAAWQAQNLLHSPSFPLYVLGFGLPLPLALVGALQRRPDLLPSRTFLLIWALVIPPLLYVPTPLQRRFLDGYQAPISILAAVGLYSVTERLRTPGGRLVLMTGLLAAASLTSILLWFGSVATIVAKVQPVFRPGWEMTAARWFRSAPGSPVVLASYDTGNLLPACAPVVSFVGHGSETVDSALKIEQAAKFFQPDTSNVWRQDLLTRYSVRYVYYGPREKQLGVVDLRTLSFLQPVYDNGHVQIYRGNSTPAPHTSVDTD